MSKGLKTLAEWNSAVDRGEAREPIPDYEGKPKTGIGCPNADVNGKVCGAHLHDLMGLYFQEIIQAKQAVHCTVCGWLGCRKIARKVINGGE